jgi:hypothetical protein
MDEALTDLFPVHEKARRFIYFTGDGIEGAPARL